MIGTVFFCCLECLADPGEFGIAEKALAATFGKTLDLARRVLRILVKDSRFLRLLKDDTQHCQDMVRHSWCLNQAAMQVCDLNSRHLIDLGLPYRAGLDAAVRMHGCDIVFKKAPIVVE